MGHPSLPGGPLGDLAPARRNDPAGGHALARLLRQRWRAARDLAHRVSGAAKTLPLLGLCLLLAVSLPEAPRAGVLPPGDAQLQDDPRKTVEAVVGDPDWTGLPFALSATPPARLGPRGPAPHDGHASLFAAFHPLARGPPPA